MGGLLGFGFSSLVVDGEVNNFTFNPTITYQGDNQTLAIQDTTTMTNTNRQDTRLTVTTTDNSVDTFTSTVIPIVINSDGNDFFLATTCLSHALIL